MKYFIIFFLLQKLFPHPLLTLPDQHQISPEGIKEILFKPVDFPCISCMRLISLFTLQCADDSAHGAPTKSFQTFCESLELEDSSNESDENLSNFCMSILSKLATPSDKYSFYDASPAHSCAMFQKNCDLTLIPKPFCFSGFCDQLLQCIDCPYGIDKEGRDYFNFIPKTCSGRGICKLGFLAEDDKSGNGFCECEKGYKGLACEFRPGKGVKALKLRKVERREEYNINFA